MRKANRFLQMKMGGEKIAMLTAYDAPTAGALAEAGIDIILVGDSVGTNMLGYPSERDVRLADMVHHTAAVRRGAPESYIVSDLPWATYETPEQAITSARELVRAGGDMVKFEGARPDVVAALVAEGIEVCCHLGLEPQNHPDKRLKGKTAADAERLLTDARVLDAAGMSMLVLELVPEEVAEAVTRAVRVPTIGIGAGAKTDGQVLVVTDALGFKNVSFRHNKQYSHIGDGMRTAVRLYIAEVRSGLFPAASNSFRMPKAEAELFIPMGHGG